MWCSGADGSDVSRYLSASSSLSVLASWYKCVWNAEAFDLLMLLHHKLEDKHHSLSYFTSSFIHGGDTTIIALDFIYKLFVIASKLSVNTYLLTSQLILIAGFAGIKDIVISLLVRNQGFGISMGAAR